MRNLNLSPTAVLGAAAMSRAASAAIAALSPISSRTTLVTDQRPRSGRRAFRSHALRMAADAEGATTEMGSLVTGRAVIYARAAATAAFGNQLPEAAAPQS